jgi:hypothetical protein
MARSSTLLLLVVFSLFLLWSTTIEASESFGNSYFSIEVTGGGKVPKYTFYLKSNSTTQYNVQFQQLFEADVEKDKYKKVGPSNVALPSLDWIVHNETSKDNITFTMKGTPKSSKKATFDSISFVNHINLKDSNETEVPVCKFDVEIANYKWVSTSNDTNLVLVFKLMATGNKTELVAKDDTVRFGGAYFYIADTAQVSGDKKGEEKDVKVQLLLGGNADSNSTDDNNGMIWLIYGHFEGNLVHDPEIGFGSGPASGGLAGWAIALIVILVIVIVGAIIAGAYFYIKKKRSYQSLE